MNIDPRKNLFVYRVRRVWRRLAKRASAVGAALVWPIERAFRSITRKIFAATERSEHMEGVLFSLGRIAASPFRTIWRLMAALGGLIFPHSVRLRLARLRRTLSRTLRRFGRFLMRFAEILNLDGLIFWLIWLTQPIWRSIAAVLGFFGAWAATRDYRQGLWALPAVLLSLPFGLILIRAAVFGNPGVAPQYRLAVTEALEEGDYARASLFERKLAQLGVDTNRSGYQTAISLVSEDDLAGAYKRMRRLAPVGQPGYPAAHFWIIQNLLAGTLDVPQSDAHRLVGIHLDHLESLGFKGPSTQVMRAIWLDAGGAKAEAAAMLEPLAHRLPEAAMERMRIHLEMNRFDEARADARLVRSHLDDRRKENEQLTSIEYKSWVIAEDILGDLRRLKSITHEWRNHDPDDIDARRSLAAILSVEFERNSRSEPPNPEILADGLLDIAQLSDEADWVYNQAVTLYRDQDHQLLGAIVDRIMQSERASTVLVTAVGVAAARANQWNDATRLLEKATVIDPTNHNVWNNYAWALSTGPNTEFERALGFATKALEMQPDDAQLRETRGQILIGLERWQEAIEDLEFAANGLPNSLDIHKSLATAYKALGNEELAQVHLDLAQ